MDMEKIVERIETCEAVMGIMNDNIVDFFHYRGLKWIENPFSEYPHDEILICEQMGLKWIENPLSEYPYDEILICEQMDTTDIEKYEKTFCETVLDIVVDEVVFYVDHVAEEEDTVPTYITDVLYLCERLCDSEPVEAVFYPTTGFVVDEEKKVRRVE